MVSSSSTSFKSTDSTPPSPLPIESPASTVPLSAPTMSQQATVPQNPPPPSNAAQPSESRVLDPSNLQLAIIPVPVQDDLPFDVVPEAAAGTDGDGVINIDEPAPVKSQEIGGSSTQQKASIRARTRAAKKRKSIDLDDNDATSGDGFDSHLFVSATAQQRSDLFAGRGIRAERLVDLKDPKQSSYSGLLDNELYSSTVSLDQGYPRDLVSEFYANASVTKPLEHGGLEIMIRGQLLVFSPRTINGFLNIAPLSSSEKIANNAVDTMSLTEIAAYLTGKTDTPIQSVNLPMKFAALAIIGSYNWIPASNKYVIADNRARLLFKIAKGIKIDFGSLIYDQVIGICASAETNNRLLVFPHLIAGMVQAQIGDVLGTFGDLIQPLSYKIDHRSGTDSATAAAAATRKDTVSQRKSKRIKKEPPSVAAKPSTSSVPVRPPTRSSSATASATQRRDTETPYSIVNLGSIRIPLESVSVSEYRSLLDDLARTARTFSTVISMAQQAIPSKSFLSESVSFND